MDERTLLPVRIKDRGDYAIGNEAKTLSRDTRGWTKNVVVATAESILKCDRIQRKDAYLVASQVDEDYIDFDSYEEEYRSRFGRPILQMILDDGEEAYDALQDEVRSAYLHAAVKGCSVWEAAQELDVTPVLVVEREEAEENIVEKIKTKYSSPDLIAATTIDNDGGTREVDLREMTPDIEWVIDHWTSLGGSGKHTRKVSPTDEDVATFEELVVDEPEGLLLDTYINQKKKGITFHHIRDREESIAKDDPDRFVMICGSSTSADADNVARLVIDSESVDERKRCGNCAKHVPAPEA